MITRTLSVRAHALDPLSPQLLFLHQLPPVLTISRFSAFFFADKAVGTDLKKALQQARQAKGLTQKQLAAQCQMQPQIINEYEQGKGIPNNQIIAKLEKVLGAKLPRAKK